MRNAWKWWLAVAGLLTTAYFVVPNSAESKLVLYNGVGLLSVLLIFVGAKKNKVVHKAPWMWIAAGLGSFLTADVIYYVLELNAGEAGAPFPSVADLFYLSMYPLVMIGLTVMGHQLSPRRDRASLIDAAVVGTAMFGALWVLFVDTTFANGSPGWGLAVQLAYPVMDVMILAVAARLIVTVHLKHVPFAFMVLGIASLAVADTAYNIYLNNGTFKTGLFIDFFWLAFYSLFAAAALHPTVRDPQLDLGEEDKLSARQLVIMFVATLSVPMIDLAWGRPEDREVTIIASALLFLLILVRVFGLTEALQRGKERLRYEAEHDALTGLSNRALFAERTSAAIAKNTTGHTAVLFIDLDDFKTVNDSLGHHAGDDLLAIVATRIADCVADTDTVGRFGGDEFAVLLEEVPDRRAATNIARRILEEIADPIDLGIRSVQASASLGIALDIGSELDVETLLRNADVAMYLSKSRGKGRYEVFEPEMHEEAMERLDLKADLQLALDKNQFVLHYQPIFDLENGGVVLVEALIRWQHPERGLIMPDRFISLAEENGSIVPIGEWVLQEACLQAAQWNKLDGCADLGVTVNLSMRQLQDSTLINSLTHALSDSGLSADHLVLEITESMLALDRDRSASILEQIKTIGVKLAIDDFGTGYSSLSYLRTFAVDSIKIDRSFINELHRSSTSNALIEAVVNLSKALGAYTVAEGIEHKDQATMLQKLGCDRGQGFYYCRPMDAASLTALLRSHVADDEAPLEAWRESSARVQDRIFDVTVRNDMKQIRRVGDDIDEINTDLGVPLMASWSWLENWAAAFSNWEPMMVEVRSAQTQQMMAYAMLAKSQRSEGTAVVAMGHGSSLHSSLPSRNNDAAHALAKGIADALNDLPGAWSLDLEQIRDFDPVMRQLANELENAQVLPELRVPHVVFSTAHAVEDVLSKSMRKQLRRARNRIDQEGVEIEISFDRGRAISTLLIDEVETVHIGRDRDNRRRSDLDRPSEREFWRRICEGGKNEWEVEIAQLRLNGELAAYVVALLDGDIYRVYDGRMSSKWQHYSPGRLVESAALNRAISDPRFSSLDWMSGVAAEKLLTTNFAEGRSRLVATSGSSYTDSSGSFVKRARIPASV